jgi:hypothetical protein
MSLSDIRVARRRWSWWRNAIVAMYVLAIALLPLTHHDIACHLKSARTAQPVSSDPRPIWLCTKHPSDLRR